MSFSNLMERAFSPLENREKLVQTSANFLEEFKITGFVECVELDSYSFSFLTKRRRQIVC